MIYHSSNSILPYYTHCNDENINVLLNGLSIFKIKRDFRIAYLANLCGAEKKHANVIITALFNSKKKRKKRSFKKKKKTANYGLYNIQVYADAI